MVQNMEVHDAMCHIDVHVRVAAMGHDAGSAHVLAMCHGAAGSAMHDHVLAM